MLNIKKKVKLSDHSTFKIGGPAKEFVEVRNERELLEAIDYAKKKKLKFFVLGGGSNILFDDKGFGGIIIKLKGNNKSIEIISEDDELEEGEEFGSPASIRIKCWAGESLSSLVNFARDNEITGLEWAAGIPGTIGGAVTGNAGAFGSSISDLVEGVRIFKVLDLPFPSKNKPVNYSVRKCGFGYRTSVFKNKNDCIILSVKLNLKKGRKDDAELRMREFVQKRMEKQPKNWYGCAGSFFKNPIVNNLGIIGQFENESKTKSVDSRVPAGWLIEQLGLKGEKIGNIMVSDVNANFLINTGEGTAEEVIIAAGIIKQKARMQFGIQLKEEVIYVPY